MNEWVKIEQWVSEEIYVREVSLEGGILAYSRPKEVGVLVYPRPPDSEVFPLPVLLVTAEGKQEWGVLSNPGNPHRAHKRLHIVKWTPRGPDFRWLDRKFGGGGKIWSLDGSGILPGGKSVSHRFPGALPPGRYEITSLYEWFFADGCGAERRHISFTFFPPAQFELEWRVWALAKVRRVGWRKVEGEWREQECSKYIFSPPPGML